jgi:hypothetical protein
MDSRLKFLSKRFDWQKLEEKGIDKYEAIVVGSKKARELYQKFKEQNLKLPHKTLFFALDLLINGKIKYKK